MDRSMRYYSVYFREFDISPCFDRTFKPLRCGMGNDNIDHSATDTHVRIGNSGRVQSYCLAKAQVAVIAAVKDSSGRRAMS